MITLGTILVAEDDASIVDLLVEVLTEEGYAVQVAVTGSDALTALQTEQLDLTLLDLHLPGLGGREVLEAARAQQIDVPIVIMTASAHTADELVAAGANACLYKPFDLDDLLCCVAQHIRRRQCNHPAMRNRPMNPAIILVDDDALVLTILKHTLADLAPDYDLVAVADGAAALALMAQRSVALVIVDYQMPDMDGIVLTAAIKAVAPQCPVILMTGYPGPEIQQRAEVAGAEYFLRKPFRVDQLATTVRTALGA